MGWLAITTVTAPTLAISLHQFCLLTPSCQHRSRPARMLRRASCLLRLLFLLQHDFLVFCIISTLSSCQSSLCYLTALRVCYFQVSVCLIIAWQSSPSQTVLVLAANRDFKAKSWPPLAGDGEVTISSNWFGSKHHRRSVSINALV